MFQKIILYQIHFRRMVYPRWSRRRPCARHGGLRQTSARAATFPTKYTQNWPHGPPHTPAPSTTLIRARRGMAAPGAAFQAIRRHTTAVRYARHGVRPAGWAPHMLKSGHMVGPNHQGNPTKKQAYSSRPRPTTIAWSPTKFRRPPCSRRSGSSVLPSSRPG